MSKFVQSLTATILFFCVFCGFTACGRPVGATTDEPATEYVNRAQLIVELVGEIAVIYEVTGDAPCLSGYEDVPDNTPLCRAVNLLDALGFHTAYPDGFWHPENPVNHAEMWKLVTQVMGFGPYAMPCADLPVNLWFTRFAGTLCYRGLLVFNEDGEVQPSAPVTVEEWETQKGLLLQWGSHEASRMDAVEKVVTLVLQENYLLDPCTSDFSDVTADSLQCYLTRVLVDEGILDSSMGEFREHEMIVWDEILSLLFSGAGLAPATCSDDHRCCNVSSERWSCGHFEELCRRGLLDGYIVQGERVMRGGLLRTTLLLKASLLF